MKVALITGNTRGIGLSVTKHFASLGYNCVITGTTTKPKATLPGTIYSTAEEIEKEFGVQALPIELDVRDDGQVQKMAEIVETEFGRVDLLVNNAGALFWQPMLKTPMKRYDLMNDINARGCFAVTQAVAPMMIRNNGGSIVNFSPPIDLSIVPQKIGYCISKFGMSLVAIGVAEELKNEGVQANALWPSTLIKSFATINFKMGDEKNWRKADILSDVCDLLVHQDRETTGQCLIDEDYLREKHNYTDEDFVKYRCDPNHEPQKMGDSFKNINRATVKDVDNL